MRLALALALAGLLLVPGGCSRETPNEPGIQPPAATQTERPYKVVHVFVALCDNKHQGIVPVPAALGNGQDPKNNLYWGAMYGVKTFFRRSPHWREMPTTEGQASGFDGAVLGSCVFKRVGAGPPVYVLAEAWDGRHIKTCILGFLRAAAGQAAADVRVSGGRPFLLRAGGRSDLVCYVGHNGFMDGRIPGLPGAASEPNPQHAVVLACRSRDDFAGPLDKFKCAPLVTTTGLMAPEAYTLDAIIRSWAQGDSPAQVRGAAAAAYAQYQKIGVRAAERLFAVPANP